MLSSVGCFLEVMGKGPFQRAAQLPYAPGITKGTGVKYASMNTVYGTNTDLSFIENFIEPTKIYSSGASNVSPLTHNSVL